MRRVFENATILCGEELEVVSGYIIVEEGKIKEIGEGKCPYKDAIDVKRGIVFPAFTNAHVHLGDSIAKDVGVYNSIEERVGKGGIKFKVLEELQKEVPLGIKGSLKEMLSLGITTFCDFREGGVKGIEQLKSVLGTSFDSVILGRPDSGDLDVVLQNCDGIGISGVSDYQFEELKKISRAVRKEGKMLGIHSAEVEDDVAKALKLRPDFLVHLTNASEQSLERVFKAKVPVILCPRSNALLGVGVPRLKEIFKNSRVALGTDNVMVNSLNMFREMEFLFKLTRGLYKDCNFDAKEVLKAATINGRKILGLQSDAIEEGNDANFIIAKATKYLYNPIVAVIHRINACDITHVVKGDVISLCTKKS